MHGQRDSCALGGAPPNYPAVLNRVLVPVVGLEPTRFFYPFRPGDDHPRATIQ